MRLKSYFAATVETAVRLARQELGDEALLVQSRKAMAEARHLGAYEVVFAVDDSVAKPKPREPADTTSETALLVQQLAKQLAHLRRQMDRLASTASWTTGVGNGPAGSDPSCWVEQVYRELLLADLDPEVARQVVEALDGAAIACHPEQTRRSVARELARLIPVAPTLGVGQEHESGHRRVVALVGPAGSGKTTMLVKLAARYGLGLRRPCQLISVDTNRIGAVEQMRSFSSILGIGFDAFESVRVLEQALAEHRHKALVLIDTPGFGPGDIGEAAELAAFLARTAWIDVHLVLPATAKVTDLDRSIDCFRPFKPAKLIFTHLDETASIGNMASVAIKSEIPVSFLSRGQAIPDDVEDASKEHMAALALEPILDVGLAGIHPRPRRGPQPVASGAGGRKEMAERSAAIA